MTTFLSPVDNELLLADKTFANIARDFGKSKKELRNAVRASTTLFIHYVVDCAAQKKQGHDENKEVTLQPQDIKRAIEELGFDSILRKLNSQQNK